MSRLRKDGMGFGCRGSRGPGAGVARVSPVAPVTLVALLTLVPLGAAPALAQDRGERVGRLGIGTVPTAAQIQSWDIDVRPDGHGVRRGRGSVADGETVYEAQCASCHGTFGESNAFMWVAGGVRPEDLKTGRAAALLLPDGQRTVGTKLGHVTTLWDYIYRAMPWTNPQSLTVDQTYAVTAYVLHLNNIVPADFVLSDENILKVPLPNRNGMTTRHGLGSVKGQPDVQGSTCMTNCAAAVTVVSSLPEFARNQHGNLAEQKRPLGPLRGVDTTRYEARKVDPVRASGVVAAASPAPAAGAAASASAAAGGAAPAAAGPATAALAQRHACTACHQANARAVGPSWREIAGKYASRGDAPAYLAGKVKSGGQGVWGAVPMPAQPNVKDDEALALARWILAGAR